MPIIETIEALPATDVKSSGNAIETPPIDKPKTIRRSPKPKYTFAQLDAMVSKEVVKIYRAEIPVSDRKLDPNKARKGDMIEAILNA